MGEIGALFLAGLSLFFTGVSGVRLKLQQLSGRRFRQALVKVTDRPVLAGLLGIVSGAVTQSASAVAFILSGMVATGLISLRRALPVVAASNVGTALLVFLAAFDIRLGALYLFGVTGLMIAFRIGSKFEALLGALFSIGLLFYGLYLMKQAFAPLPSYKGFQDIALFVKDWAFAPFLLGAALRMVIQSSSAIGVIAIALQVAGLFTDLQSLILVCGAGPGVALSGLFLSGNLSGPPRQIVLYQGLINLISGTLLALVIFLSGEQGFLVGTINQFARNANDCLAWVFFINMSGCLLIGLAILPWSERLLQKLAPPTLEQNISKPMYLYEEALQVPNTAVDLLDKEQQRLFSLVVKLVDGIREENKAMAAPMSSTSLHAGAKALGGEILTFVEELINREISGDTASAILRLERRQENLDALLDTVHQFIDNRKGTVFGEKLNALMDRLTESLHLILLTATDAWISRDSIDREYLLKLTGDRGDMMEHLRRSYQVADEGSALGQSSALFYATTLFERAIWLARQIGLSLEH